MRRKATLVALLIPLLVAAPGPLRDWMGTFGAAPNAVDDGGDDRSDITSATGDRPSPLPRAIVRSLIEDTLPASGQSESLVNDLLYLVAELPTPEGGSLPPELTASLLLGNSATELDGLWAQPIDAPWGGLGSGGRGVSSGSSGGRPERSGDIVAVSEPSSMALLGLGLGLGLCAGLARRRGGFKDRSGSRRRRSN